MSRQSEPLQSLVFSVNIDRFQLTSPIDRRINYYFTGERSFPDTVSVSAVSSFVF